MPDPLEAFQDRLDYAEALREVFAEQWRESARQRMTGSISGAEWQGQMRGLLKTQYGMMVVVAAGGDPSRVSADDWLALGPQLRSQYRYLEQAGHADHPEGMIEAIAHGVVQLIRDNPSLIEESVKPYADAER